MSNGYLNLCLPVPISLVSIVNMTDPAYSEQSSPFLDLPTELRELILVKYYENSSLIVVTHRQNRIERPRVAGVPSLNIERACKALLKESLAVRRKHITQNLIVKDSYFVYCGMNSFCYSTKFKWVRKHITSIQLSLVLNIFMLPYWPSLVNGFPNLKNLEFQVSIQVALPASRTRRYMPLDEGKNQRGLAEDVVKGDWDNDCALSTIKSKLHDIETVYHRARDRSARDSMNYFRLSREESTIRVKISTRAVNEQSNHLHDAVRPFLGPYP